MKYMISWFERSQGSPMEYEKPEADPGGFPSMEGAGELQDRGVRYTPGRVGWAYAGGLRRSDDGSQVLLDAPRI